jgi:hypothetical protein
MNNFIFGNQPIQPVPAVSQETATLVKIGQYLLVAGAIIDITTTNDQVLIFGAFIKLIAIALFINASLREAREQQIAPGVTTSANKEKIAGSLITAVAALFLTDALLRESAIRRATGVAQPTFLPAVGGTGAFSV